MHLETRTPVVCPKIASFKPAKSSFEVLEFRVVTSSSQRGLLLAGGFDYQALGFAWCTPQLQNLNAFAAGFLTISSMTPPNLLLIISLELNRN